MITRIVKMSFKPSEVDAFKKIYKENWQRIKAFEGCSHVELLQAHGDPGVFFTYSHWESQEKLDNYRHSELFTRVWGATKILFNGKPQAWSTEQIL